MKKKSDKKTYEKYIRGYTLKIRYDEIRWRKTRVTIPDKFTLEGFNHRNYIRS